MMNRLPSWLMVTSGTRTCFSPASASFRAKTRALESRQETLDNGADQYDKDVKGFNARLVERNKRCASLNVTKADRDAVMKERAAAGKK